jgi:hypothetical protein
VNRQPVPIRPHLFANMRTSIKQIIAKKRAANHPARVSKKGPKPENARFLSSFFCWTQKGGPKAETPRL